MADPQLVLGSRVQAALGAAYGAGYADADPVIRPSSFTDFQSNVALPLAKRLGAQLGKKPCPGTSPPRSLRHLDVADI